MVESVVESRAEVVVDSTKNSKIRVLHVDDEPALLKVAKECLEIQGPFEVDSVFSVEEATGRLKKEAYDAIVSDYQMPRKNGLQFLKELRANRNSIPFIIFTGKGREEVAIEALNLGANQYLSKTGDPATVYCELAHGIQQAVEKNKTEEELRRFSAAVRTSSDGIITADLNGNIIDLNDAALRMCGGTNNGDLIGKNVFDFLIESDRVRALQDSTESMRTGQSKTAEYRAIMKNGTEVPIEITTALMRDQQGEPIGFVDVVRNIAERQKVELELQSSEKKYRELTDQLPVIVYEIDLNGRFTFVNEKAFEITGYSREDFEKGLNIHQMVVDKDLDKLKARIQKALCGEKIDYSEYTILKKDGSTFPAIACVGAIVSEGKIMGLRCIVTDITERKKAEETLQEGEHRLRTYLDSIHTGILLIDAETHVILDANAPTIRMFGDSKDRIVGSICHKFVCPAEKGCCPITDLGQNVDRSDRVLIKANGEALSIIKTVVPAYLGDRKVLIESFIDVADRKKAEEELKESEEKYRELFESIQDPVCIYVEEEGRLIDYNTAFKELFGYSDEELKGKVFLDFVHPEDQTMVMQRYQTRYPAKDFPVMYEIRGMNKKGEPIPIEISVSAFKRKGRIIGVEVVHRCIIERKRYERSLSELNIYSEKLNAAKSMGEIYELTLEAAEKTLGFEFADILTIKEKMLCLATRRGHSKISSLELPLDGDKGITVRVARTGETVFVPDISKDESYVEGGLQTRSELAVPIKIGRKVVGVLNAERKEVNAFDEKDKELLEILASHAATAISNLDRAKKLETSAREIHENERKLERLFVNIPEASVYTDSNLRIVEINPRFCELFGYSLDEVKGRHIDDVLVPKNKIDEAKMLREEFMKGRAYRETVRQRKDGTLVPVSMSVAPIIVEDKAIGYVGLYRDITERKRYEERLSALNIYSRDLNMAGSMVEIQSLTLDAMQKVLGFEYADFFITETGMLRIVDQRGYSVPFPLELPLDGSKKGISIKAARTGNSVIVQDVRDDIDFVEGLPGTLSELAVPIKIGQKILGVLNVESKRLSAFDEKDRELLEILASHAATAISNLEYAKSLESYAQEIRESQQKFEGLFMASPEAAVHVGPDICILNVNPRFEMLFGYKLDEIRGKNLNDVVVPEDRIDEARMLDRIAEQEKHVSQNTVRRKKDGSLVPVFVSSAPITVEGRFLGYVAVYKDISELKNAEKKLELMNEKLRVTGGLTRHDVRNKLSTVAGNVYMLKKRLADNSDALDKLKTIDSAVQQTVRIFDFAKAYEMLGIEELSYIDVAKTLDDAVSLFPSSINVKVVNECHGMVVLADPLLRQLFYNLIDNSLKHGQKVSRIRVYHEGTDLNNLTLVYEDDGVGIPASEKPNLFQQGYSTGGSTGYGLYLISKMVEVYGWTIQETGAPGKGARFTMAIPKVYRDGRESARVSAFVNP